MESLLLFRRALSSPTMCRFIPALSVPHLLSRIFLRIFLCSTDHGGIDVVALASPEAFSPIQPLCRPIMSRVDECSPHGIVKLRLVWLRAGPRHPFRGYFVCLNA